MWYFFIFKSRTLELLFSNEARETKEEIGLEVFPDKIKLLFSETKNNEHTDIYLAFVDSPKSQMSFDPNEVAQIRWVSFSTILEMLESNLFINYGDNYFQNLFHKR